MEFFAQILASDLLLTASGFITACLLLGIAGLRSNRKFLVAIAENAPAILTSLGIFFTFLGISFALLSFDVANINAAIPPLLDGLKIAFLSSVGGLGAAILFRFLRPVIQKESAVAETSANDILNELKEVTKSTLSVREALIGEGDASLSTQMSKLRNDFQDFAKKVSEDGSKALIEALEQVIREFNTKISEQFGENFKQLNEAVSALLEWQKEYRNQVEQLTEAFKETQKGIESVKDSVTAIETSTQKIPEQMESLEKAFNSTEDRIAKLYEGLGSLADMRQKAEESVPYIQRQMTEMTDGLKKTIEEQMQFVSDMTTSLKDTQEKGQQSIQNMLETYSEGFEAIISQSLNNSEQIYSRQQEKFKDLLDNFSNGTITLLETTKEVNNQIQKTIADFQSEQQRASTEIQTKISESLAQNTEVLNQSLQDLDSGMQLQLQRSLDIMGNNLASITKHFVKTYEQSTQKINQEISRLANRN